MEKIIHDNKTYLNRLIASAFEMFPYYGPYREKERHWRGWKSDLRRFFNSKDLKNYGIKQQHNDHQFLNDISSILNLRVITIDVHSLECTIFGPQKPFEYSNTRKFAKEVKKNLKKKTRPRIFCGNIYEVSLRSFSHMQDTEIPWIFLKRPEIDCHGNKFTDFLLLPIGIRGRTNEVKFTCDWKLGLPCGTFRRDALFLNQLYFIRGKTIEMHNIESETSLISEAEPVWRVHPNDEVNARLLNTILDHLVQGSNFERGTGFKLRRKNEPNRKRKLADNQNDPNQKRKRTKFYDDADSIGQMSSNDDLDEDPDLALWQGRISEVPEEAPEEVADKEWVIDLEEDPAVTLWREKIRKMRERLNS